MTIEQGLAVINRQLDALLGVHRAPIEAADSIVMSELPVYTGAYMDAVSTRFESTASEISVSLSALQSSNAALAADLGGRERVFENIHGSGPEGPYPVRIELLGGPVSGDGADAWDRATEQAQKVLNEELAAVGSLR